MRVLIMIAVFCVIGSTVAPAQEMSVAEAYKVQRHKQTTFNKKNANMSKLEAEYLDHLFFVTDMAFRERMVMLQYFGQRKDVQYIDHYNKEIGNLLASFELIKAPGRTLPHVEKLVEGAIIDQKKFFNEWHDAYGTDYYDNISRSHTSHQLVQSAHKKLIQSYGLLKQAYPREAAHNQQSFYDHLCALDFI